MRLVMDKELPGFGELMRRVSLEEVPTAILSRQTAGIRGRSLIVNLPGKPASIAICLDAVFPAIPYCLELIGASPLVPIAERPAWAWAKAGP
jgi:molybdopterin adenylyltransferase